jgi:hypothetical protein
VLIASQAYYLYYSDIEGASAQVHVQVRVSSEVFDRSTPSAYPSLYFGCRQDPKHTPNGSYPGKRTEAVNGKA